MAPKPSVSPKPAPSPTAVQPKPAAVPAKPTPVQRQGIYHSALKERPQYALVICRKKSDLHVSNFFTASILSRAEQQAIFLQDRQLAFKKAALQAKTNGDMELAKKYLRMAKVGHNDCSSFPHEEPNSLRCNKAIYVLTKIHEQRLLQLVFKQGFDQMIEAAHSGLPVDMGQVSSIFCSKSNGHLCFKVEYLVTHPINYAVQFNIFLIIKAKTS